MQQDRISPSLVAAIVATGLMSCAPSMGAHLRVQVPPQAGHSE